MHGCMVYTERAETAAASRGISHTIAVSTPLPWIFIKAYKKLVTHVDRITCEGSESARERRIALYKIDHHVSVCDYCSLSSRCVAVL